ncbi:hypothetical protein L2E82_33838 [Cichorium intybus]|uniref:Uncharacterized protein n=1 Tax=Cichorium intybus TaxID=13427 RepID=A0ACB9BL61_CICIN|nr:hypothetical protein L2E82_33838 [Cichorium intybus]
MVIVKSFHTIVAPAIFLDTIAPSDSSGDGREPLLCFERYGEMVVAVLIESPCSAIESQSGRRRKAIKDWFFVNIDQEACIARRTTSKLVGASRTVIKGWNRCAASSNGNNEWDLCMYQFYG